MCKMERFGNCDPETADQEYCIFHKPNKTEEEAKEFWRKFLKRFKPRVEEIEVEDESGQKRKIKRFVFEKPVDARGFVFPKLPKNKTLSLNIRNTLTLADSVFEGKLIINYSRFDKNINIKKARFLGGMELSNSIFNNKLTFAGSVFSNHVFVQNCEFNRDLDLSGVIFEDVVEFHNCKFAEYLKAWGTIFEKSVEFIDCVFHNVSYRSIFRGLVKFNGSVFEGILRIAGSNFNGPCMFHDIKKEHNIYKLSTFKGKFVVSNSIFNYGIYILDVDSVDILTGRFSVDALSEAARLQRLSYEKEGKREEADRMFVIEMRTKRKLRLLKAQNNGWKGLFSTKIRNFFEWLLGDLPSEYGTSWQKILKTSILVVLLFGFIYWITLLNPNAGAVSVLFLTAIGLSLWYFQTFDKPETKKISALVTLLIWLALVITYFHFPLSTEGIIKAPNILDNNGNPLVPKGEQFTKETAIGTLLNALYYSLVTFTTLGYGDMHPTGWLKALSAIEALTGAVFMALIVAVIARKWMR